MQHDAKLMTYSPQIKSRQTAGQNRWLRVVMTLFGLSLSTNVVYVFTIGNTCVYIGYVFAFILCGYLFISDRKSGCVRLDLIDRSIWMFVAVACLSVFLSIVYAISEQLPSETPLVVIRGLIVLFCGLAVYYVVVRLPEYAECLVIGLALGVVTNGAVSMLQMIAFESGSYFTLYYLFPQDSFSISANWSTWGALPGGAGRIPYFRSQGLFLEASHLMVFLTCVAPVAFTAIKSIVARVGILIVTAFCCMTSSSPNVFFILVECVLLLSHSRKSNKKFRVRRGWILISIIALIVFTCVMALHSDFVLSSFTSVAKSIADLNVFTSDDTGTTARWKSMLNALSAYMQYPLGAGWNTESLVLTHIYGANEAASHSYVIRLLLEMGIVGVIAYFVLIMRHSKLLISHGLHIEELAIGMAVLFLFVCQATNGMALVPWAWALLGLSSAASKRVEQRLMNVR